MTERKTASKGNKRDHGESPESVKVEGTFQHLRKLYLE